MQSLSWNTLVDSHWLPSLNIYISFNLFPRSEVNYPFSPSLWQQTKVTLTWKNAFYRVAVLCLVRSRCKYECISFNSFKLKSSFINLGYFGVILTSTGFMVTLMVSYLFQWHVDSCCLDKHFSIRKSKWMINTETPEVNPHNATSNFPTNKPFSSMQVRSVTSVLLKSVLNSIRVSEGKLQFKRSDWHFKCQKRELFP